MPEWFSLVTLLTLRFFEAGTDLRFIVTTIVESVAKEKCTCCFLSSGREHALDLQLPVEALAMKQEELTTIYCSIFKHILVGSKSTFSHFQLSA